MDGVPRGVLDYGLLLVAVGLGTLLLARAGRIATGAISLARKTDLLRTPPPAPAARSIERLAAELRRLRREVERPRAGITMARQRGVLWAYDDNLVLACNALDIETAIRAMPEGLDREAERARLEMRLREAGLTW